MANIIKRIARQVGGIFHGNETKQRREALKWFFKLIKSSWFDYRTNTFNIKKEPFIR